MYKIGETEMVSCPYNRYHIVSKLRIQSHIIKCQKNYPEMKLATCFYNYSHRLKPEDMLKHYEICSHKTRLEGSRYYESDNLYDPHCLEDADPYTEKFPDINAKPVFFKNPVKSSVSKPRVSNVEKKYTSSESESDYSQLKVAKSVKTEFSGSDCDDDLEPLPLPKTKSKAFVCVHQNEDELTSQAFPNKKFGRGKNFMEFSPYKPTTSSDKFKMDLSTVKSHKEKGNEESNFFSKAENTSIIPSVFEFDHVLKEPESFLSSSGATIKSSLNDGNTLKSGSQLLSNSSFSITSSMFEDGSTLNSEEIIFDEDYTEDSESDDKIILRNFNESLKIL